MTDRTTNNLGALLTPAPSHGVQFSQGKVLTWDNERLHNTIEWRGITLTDVPIVEGINALVIRPGDVIGMLGWAPENAKGVGSWWILGKLSNPGEFVADLDVTAKIFRFMTEDDHVLAFFGKESDGDPLWFMTYGGADETRAIGIINGEVIQIRYRGGTVAVGTVGTVGSQFLQIRDQTGNVVFATDGASLVGLARPYLNIPMVPSSGTSVVAGGPFWPAFTNVNYQEVMHGFTSLWHPRISIGISQSVTAGTIEWQLRVDGVTAGSSSGSGSATFDVPGWGSTTNPDDVRAVQLFARNTSGTQSRLIVNRCYGTQA
jgi:hypothetical protein